MWINRRTRSAYGCHGGRHLAIAMGKSKLFDKPIGEGPFRSGLFTMSQQRLYYVFVSSFHPGLKE